MKDILFVAMGFVLLFLGGEGLLRGSVSLAHHFRLSKILIGAVIIGFGTSMPELSVCLGAALKGSPDIALGNVIGSNIANILLIIGLSSLIHPIFVEDPSIRRDVFSMVFSSLGLLVLMALDQLTWVGGLFFLAALFLYVFRSFKGNKEGQNAMHENMDEDLSPDQTYRPSTSSFLALTGMGSLVVGAGLLIEGAVSMAKGYGVPEAIIGLTLVAVGTSLPEIAVAVIASYKKHGDVVVGNILGSNIFNILAILGITLVIYPIPVSPHLMTFDIWILLGVSLLLALLLLKRITIGRKTGAMMVAAYFLYALWLYTHSA